MTSGVLLIAKNNGQLDYVKQAYFLALRVSKYLNLPTSILTDDVDYVNRVYPGVFDHVINVDSISNNSHRIYRDGTYYKRVLEFKNVDRVLAYDYTPYDETLLLDTDFIISNDIFKQCFEQQHNFLIYKDAVDLAGWRDTSEFQTITPIGPQFYWATCVFFRKSNTNKIFFDLLKHITENWLHYKIVYNIPHTVFRNDYVFSIGIHIMNGYIKNDFARKMPGVKFYITDRDLCLSIEDDEFLLLTERKDSSLEYNPHKVKGSNVHIMNKFSLNRIIDNA